MIQKRIRLGILFNFNPVWMGGIIYILNLIKTLDFLEEDEKPEIILFYKPELRKFVDEINYPFFKAIEWKFPTVYKGFLKSWLSRKNVFVHDIIRQYNLDGVYPLHDYPVKTKTSTKLVCWYADLQHEYYPEFFSRRKIMERTMRIKFILKNSDYLVVSSKAVADDFNKFFRLRKGMKMNIFHFVTVVNDVSLDIIEIRKKYNLPEKYFMISNQFHKHKNHKILLKSLALIKDKDPRIHMAMTGRFPDATHSPYMQELHSLIDKYNLKRCISFLGIIPRDEQLLLMKHSQAVIQPSLFEGWSTVIEDAISLQVPVIASNLNVNIEQLGDTGKYFDPDRPEELAELLLCQPERCMTDKFYEDYHVRMKNAAAGFMKIFSN